MSDNMKEAYFDDLDGGGYSVTKHKELKTKSILYLPVQSLP